MVETCKFRQLVWLRIFLISITTQSHWLWPRLISRKIRLWLETFSLSHCFLQISRWLLAVCLISLRFLRCLQAISSYWYGAFLPFFFFFHMVPNDTGKLTDTNTWTSVQSMLLPAKVAFSMFTSMKHGTMSNNRKPIFAGSMQSQIFWFLDWTLHKIRALILYPLI